MYGKNFGTSTFFLLKRALTGLAMNVGHEGLFNISFQRQRLARLQTLRFDAGYLLALNKEVGGSNPLSVQTAGHCMFQFGGLQTH